MAGFAAVIGAWSLAGLLLATQAWFAGAVRGEPIAWGRTLAIWLAWAYAWALLTPLALALATRFPIVLPRRWQAAAVHAVSGAALAALNLALFAAVAPLVGAISAGPTWAATFSRLLATTFLLNLPVYWLLVGAAHALRAARRAAEHQVRQARLESQLADARLVALRAQLEPHFLFNALNTVAVLMREDVEAADRVLVQLSVLLRRALQVGEAIEIPLREELALAEAYLAVEQARFADRMAYRVEVDGALLDARVPSLILQPLVENAIRHGLAARAESGRVEITVAAHDGALRLSVYDDGPGITPAAVDGVGLSNTRARLDLLYGDRCVFRIGPAPGGGTLAEMSIPLRTGTPS